MKKKITLEGQAGKISGILTYPDDALATGTNLSAVLLLHGFGTDKNEVNSIYQEMASMFEPEDMVSLRIDFFGYGESNGQPEDSSVDTMIADAKIAFDYLCSLPYVEANSIGIVGFSLGAAIAMLLTKRVSCRTLALLSPALNLANDFTVFLGQTVMDALSHCDHFVDVDLSWRKIKIGRQFYDSLFQHSPLTAIKHYKGPLFCIAGEKDFSAENADDIYWASPSPTKSIEFVGGADHIFSLKNGDSELYLSAAEAVLWLQKNLALPMSRDNVHVWHSEVKPQEIDIQNIVNNSYYLNYFDQARIQFLLSKGIDWEVWHKNGYNLVLAHVDMSLKFPLKAKNQFYVTSTMERSGRLKILFTQKIFRKSDNKLVAEAINTVVYVSIKNSKPVFPPELEDLLFLKKAIDRCNVILNDEEKEFEKAIASGEYKSSIISRITQLKPTFPISHFDYFPPSAIITT